MFSRHYITVTWLIKSLEYSLRHVVCYAHR